MLIGSVQHSIDDKGRYIVPAKFRLDLGDSFVVTQGVDGCLFVFTLVQWEEVAAKLAAMPADDEETLRFKRDFFAFAYDLEVDKQFRVVLPPPLRAAARLDRDVVSVGMSTRVEIWDRAAWEAYHVQSPISDRQKTAVLAGVVL